MDWWYVPVGISEAVSVVGSTRDEVKGYVGDGSAFGLSVTYVVQDAPRGLAHAVQISEEALGGSPLVMFLGDNVLLHGIAEEAAVFRAHPDAHRILLAQVPEPQRFGVAVLEGEKVGRLVEKPKVPPSSWALVGVYFFRPAIFEAVKAIPPSARGEYEITDAIQLHIPEESGHPLHWNPDISPLSNRTVFRSNPDTDPLPNRTEFRWDPDSSPL